MHAGAALRCGHEHHADPPHSSVRTAPCSTSRAAARLLPYAALCFAALAAPPPPASAASVAPSPSRPLPGSWSASSSDAEVLPSLSDSLLCACCTCCSVARTALQGGRHHEFYTMSFTPTQGSAAAPTTLHVYLPCNCIESQTEWYLVGAAAWQAAQGPHTPSAAAVSPAAAAPASPPWWSRPWR